MPRSATVTVLLFLLTALTVPASTSGGEKETQTRQSFRVHVPGEIRIFATNYDTNGQPQILRISSGMDVSVTLQRQSAAFVEQPFVCMVQEGRAVNIPVTQSADTSSDRFVTQVTILPGW